MELSALIDHAQKRIDTSLHRWLPPSDESPTRLHQAMRYATLEGGKRVRPLLVYATGRVLDVAETHLDGPACALEMIHAYSLVHDDLPAMDDDDLRRGRPTCHKAFDEATAILVGDALQSLAFEILTTDPTMPDNIQVRLAMIQELAQAAGSRGMCGGQAIDIDATGQSMSLPELEKMHLYKTGALIRASVRFAALARPDLEHEVRSELDHYATAIGLAFQIRDDILDVEADTETLGKPQGSDAAANKSTYTSLLGLDGAKEKLAQVHQSALSSLERFGDRAEPLRVIANYIVERAY